jgi:hypothetical protein
MTRLVTIALVLLALGGVARAQDLEAPRSRQGYYIGGGLHASLQHNRDDDGSLGTYRGYATAFRMGQLLTPRLGLGFALDLGGGTHEDDTVSTIGLGLAGQLVLAENLALHAGVGLGVVSLTEKVGDDEELRGSYGSAYTVGLTYDWFIRPCWTGGIALTPTLQVRALPGDPIDSYTLMFGLEITRWTGLPRNQLDLPPDQAFRKD